MAGPLNAKMQEVLEQSDAFHALPLETLSPENARNLPTITDAYLAVIGGHVAKRAWAAFPEPVGRIEHQVIPGKGGEILIRIYTPKGAKRTSGSAGLPVLVYFHGGGWVIANLDTYDGSCRALCNESGFIVISVAYRQAPEYPFPAAAEDAFSAYQWVLSNAESLGGDSPRIAVGGESAGGNLAAVVCLQARDQGFRLPIHQLLVDPITNSALDTASYLDNKDAKPLNERMMRWFWKDYLKNELDGTNPLASPMQAKLKGLPSATVITAEIDPLRSEGEAYAEKLKQAGIPACLSFSA